MERFAGRYLLLRPLGRGGMGDVHLARDLANGSECALKRISSSAPDIAPELLRKEYESLARVRHPAVVGVRDIGVAADGTAYITMEYVPGLPADRVLRSGDWASLSYVAAQMASGLQAIHQAGIVHGDLKPSNLLVTPGDTAGDLPVSVKLVDFGLAGLLGEDAEGHRGTPGFAAPETVRGEAPSVASDLYGAGATLYQLISSKAPFAEEEPGAVLRRQQSAPPPALPLEETGCPAALVQLVLRLMAVEPAERPSDARELRMELERIHPAARRPLDERLETTIVVGRERELAQLERRLTEAARRTRMMNIVGDAGSGKTTLLQEIASRAALAGNRVVRCSIGSSVDPGNGALTLLRAIAGVAGDVANVDGATTQLLDAARTSLASEDAGELVAAAVAHLTHLSTESRAPLVVIDDAEGLDALSRNLIRRIMLAPDAPSALWVLARRGGADSLSEDDQLLEAAGHAETIMLEGLDDSGVAGLIAARLGDVAPDGLVEAIRSRTAGHPGLTVDALRSAARSGALTEGDVGFVVDRQKLEALGLPENFEQSRLEKLAALGKPAQDLAAFLAVVGRPVIVEELPAEAVDDPEEAVRTLGEGGLGAAHQRTIALQPPALGRAILSQHAPGRVAELHRAALKLRSASPRERFEHLRALGETEDAIRAAEEAFTATRDHELAKHAAEMLHQSDSIAAALWLDRAADVLLERGKLAEAAEVLDEALALDSESDAKFERWIKAGRSFVRLGRVEDASSILGRALEDRSPDHVRIRLLSLESMRRRFRGDIDGAQEAAEAAMVLAKGSNDGTSVGSAALALSAVDIMRRDWNAARSHGELAHENFETVGDPDGLLAATSNLALSATSVGDNAEALRLASQGAKAARAAENQFGLLRLLLLQGSTLTTAGEWTRARAAYAEATRIALIEGVHRDAALTLANLAQMDALTGRARTALRNARAAARLSRRHEPRALSLSLRSLAIAHRVRGHEAAATRYARRATSALRASAYPGDRDWATLELALALMASRNTSEAEGILSRLSRAADDGVARSLAATRLGLIELGAQRFDSAVQSMNSADNAISKNPAPHPRAWAGVLRAAVLMREGEVESSISLARASLKTLSQLPSPGDHAAACLVLAETADASEASASAAIQWLETAASIYSRLGNRKGAEVALSRLVTHLKAQGGGPIKAQNLSLIDNVASLLSSLSEPSQLAQRAMKMAVDAMDAERGVLLQIDPESDRLIPIAEYGALDPSTRQEALGYSRRVVQRVTESGVGMVLGDAVSDPSLRSESVINLNLRSIVCVPMHVGGRTIGAVYLDDSRRPEAFSDDDRGMLEGFAQLMAIAIDRSRGHAEVIETNERLVGENLALRKEVGARYQSGNVLGSSSQMRKVLAAVEQAAQVNSTVMITGEMGTGKELIARTLHHTGKRRLRPFLAVNCGAIPENLIAAELFGILPNVATDVHARPGRFVESDGGTLFLDEIGEMPLSQQVALLSVLANREVTPVGGGKPIPIDVRVICASNRDLREQLEKGDFRGDLFYRLNVIQIDIPPLRDRKADIPLLAHHFLAQFAAEQDRAVPEMSPEFMAALMQSDWKGNVRELQNYIERILAMTPGPVLYPDPPPRDLEERAGTVQLKGRRPLPEMVEELEKRMVREALDRANGNQSRAARDLGITEQSIRYRIKKFGLDSARRNRRDR